jgi:hypothetical protein
MGRFALDSSETKLPISGEKGKVIISKMPGKRGGGICASIARLPHTLSSASSHLKSAFHVRARVARFFLAQYLYQNE